MAVPTTKAAFKELCLRRLGKPVIEINVDDDQVDDRVDQALAYYQDTLQYQIVILLVSSIFLILEMLPVLTTYLTLGIK